MGRSADKWFSLRTEFFNVDSYTLGLFRLSPTALACYFASSAYAAQWGLDYCLGYSIVQHVTGRRRTSVVKELVAGGFWIPSTEDEGRFRVAHEGTLWRRGTPLQRRAIPVSIRAAVMERDHYECVECGEVDGLTLDHIWPYSRGGEDSLENLRVLCRSCNSAKGARV